MNRVRVNESQADFDGARVTTNRYERSVISLAVSLGFSAIALSERGGYLKGEKVRSIFLSRY